MAEKNAGIGQIVYYRLSEQDIVKINQRESGLSFDAGEVFPMVITKVCSIGAHVVVNGQVFLDGDDLLWVISVPLGQGHGSFEFPPQEPCEE